MLTTDYAWFSETIMVVAFCDADTIPGVQLITAKLIKYSIKSIVQIFSFIQLYGQNEIHRYKYATWNWNW